MKLFYLFSLCLFLIIMPQVIAAQAGESEHFLMSKEDTIRLAHWISAPMKAQLPSRIDLSKEVTEAELEYDREVQRKFELMIFFARHGNYKVADTLLEWMIDGLDVFLTKRKPKIFEIQDTTVVSALYGLIAEEDSIEKIVQAYAKQNNRYSVLTSVYLAIILLGRDQQRFEKLADQLMTLCESENETFKSFVEAFFFRFTEYSYYHLLKQRFVELNQELIDNLGLKDWFELFLNKQDKSHDEEKQQPQEHSLIFFNDLLISAAKSRDNNWSVREGVFDTLGIEDIGKAIDTNPAVDKIITHAPKALPLSAIEKLPKVDNVDKLSSTHATAIIEEGQNTFNQFSQ